MEGKNMKKATLTISYDEEKMTALKLYLEHKGTAVEDELTKALETLYTKSVPAGVREFLALRSGEAAEPSAPKARKQKAPQNERPQETGADGHPKPQM